MLLKHADIWRAIDRLAEENGLSPSGLARKAGLSPTIFNPSKRESKRRPRWPSTESIAHVLQATGTSLDEFVGFTSPAGTALRTALPLIGLNEAEGKGVFDKDGYPSGRGWDEITFPALADAHAFAIEIAGKNLEPIYREGDRLIVSPAEKRRRGDRVLLRTRKGEVLVRHMGREGAHRIELAALNPGREPLTFSMRDIEWIYRIVWASQ